MISTTTNRKRLKARKRRRAYEHKRNIKNRNTPKAPGPVMPRHHTYVLYDI